jgi:transcription elongation factor GreA
MTLGQVLYITEMGRLILESEVACLRSLRREVAAELALCNANAGSYTRQPAALKAEAAAIDREARSLQDRLSLAVQLPTSDRRVAVGSQVRLRGPRGRHHVVTLVGPLSANPTMGLVSFESPLGRLLLGRKVGEVVNLREMGYDWDASILEVEPGALAGSLASVG